VHVTVRIDKPTSTQYRSSEAQTTHNPLPSSVLLMLSQTTRESLNVLQITPLTTMMWSWQRFIHISKDLDETEGMLPKKDLEFGCTDIVIDKSPVDIPSGRTISMLARNAFLETV